MEEKIFFDYSKLRGRIKEVFGTQDNFAKKVKMGRVGVSQRLNNLIDFSDKEILRWSNALKIELEGIPLYFFTPKVQKGEQNESA